MQPIAKAPSRILFVNAKVFDGEHPDTFSGTVLVEGDRIAAVSRGKDLATTDAQRIDGSGCTLMPGLIDIHAHLALGSSVEQINPPGNRPDADTALLIAHSGRVMLDHGFTGCYSGGSGTVLAEVAARKAFDAGWVPGPRMKTSSLERMPGGPVGLVMKFPGYVSRRADPADLVSFIQEMHAAGVEAAKFLLNGVSAFDPGTNLGEQFYDEEILAVGKAAARLGMSLTAHCYTPHSIQLALRAGFNMLYHLGWADEASLDAVERFKRDIFVGPAPGIVEADLLRGPDFGVMASPEMRKEQAEGVERIKRVGTELRKRGVRSCPGGDYGFPWNPVGTNARDIELFVEWFGYSHAEALTAATATAGLAVAGAPDKLGVVKDGAFADLLLVAGDPTRNVSLLRSKDNLRAVMRGGRLHKAPTSA